MDNKTVEKVFKIEIIENPFVGSVYPSKKKWGVKFTIGVQSFTLSIQRNKKEVQWYVEQLTTALNNLASLQCAELKKENDGLRGLIYVRECERDGWSKLYKRVEAENESLKKLLKGVLPMAEDGYTLHKKNGSHQEFLSDDRELLQEIKVALNPISK